MLRNFWGKSISCCVKANHSLCAFDFSTIFFYYLSLSFVLWNLVCTKFIELLSFWKFVLFFYGAMASKPAYQCFNGLFRFNTLCWKRLWKPLGNVWFFLGEGSNKLVFQIFHLCREAVYIYIYIYICSPGVFCISISWAKISKNTLTGEWKPK